MVRLGHEFVEEDPEVKCHSHPIIIKAHTFDMAYYCHVDVDFGHLPVCLVSFPVKLLFPFPTLCSSKGSSLCMAHT